MTERLDKQLFEQPALVELAASLGEVEQLWLVGGVVRDALLGRNTTDFDLITAAEPEALARRFARDCGGAIFPLSEEFETWRVVSADREWQVDLSKLRGGSLAADLALRDFTVNAIAAPLAKPGEIVDPLGGVADITAGRLRMVSTEAFAADPLRTMRMVRQRVELNFAIDPATMAAAAASAPLIQRVAAERIFEELSRTLCSDLPLEGVELLKELGLLQQILPELTALQGVQQSRFHHLDVYDHTVEVLKQVLALEQDLANYLPEQGKRIDSFLKQSFADGLNRWQALRFSALLHDIAKPLVYQKHENGHITFYDHDRRGEQLTLEIMTRLKVSGALRSHLQALTLHHLRLGYLVKQYPLSPGVIYDYLAACEPVQLDVTVLSIADRLATCGEGSEVAIQRHLELANQVASPALDWFEYRQQRPLIRGDHLADQLGIKPSSKLGELLKAIDRARYCGEVEDANAAVSYAQQQLAQ